MSNEQQGRRFETQMDYNDDDKFYIANTETNLPTTLNTISFNNLQYNRRMNELNSNNNNYGTTVQHQRPYIPTTVRPFGNNRSKMMPDLAAKSTPHHTMQSTQYPLVNNLPFPFSPIHNIQKKSIARVEKKLNPIKITFDAVIGPPSMVNVENVPESTMMVNVENVPKSSMMANVENVPESAMMANVENAPESAMMVNVENVTKSSMMVNLPESAMMTKTELSCTFSNGEQLSNMDASHLFQMVALLVLELNGDKSMSSDEIYQFAQKHNTANSILEIAKGKISKTQRKTNKHNKRTVEKSGMGRRTRSQLSKTTSAKDTNYNRRRQCTLKEKEVKTRFKSVLQRNKNRTMMSMIWKDGASKFKLNPIILKLPPISRNVYE